MIDWAQFLLFRLRSGQEVWPGPQYLGCGEGRGDPTLLDNHFMSREILSVITGRREEAVGQGQ